MSATSCKPKKIFHPDGGVDRVFVTLMFDLVDPAKYENLVQSCVKVMDDMSTATEERQVVAELERRTVRCSIYQQYLLYKGKKYIIQGAHARFSQAEDLTPPSTLVRSHFVSKHVSLDDPPASFFDDPDQSIYILRNFNEDPLKFCLQFVKERSIGGTTICVDKDGNEVKGYE